MHHLEHDDTPTLTPRQQAVLALLATGLTSVEASDVLQIPVDEMHTEVHDIIRALGARSKLKAVILAHRGGLIQLPGCIGVRVAQGTTRALTGYSWQRCPRRGEHSGTQGAPRAGAWGATQAPLGPHQRPPTRAS